MKHFALSYHGYENKWSSPEGTEKYLRIPQEKYSVRVRRIENEQLLTRCFTNASYQNIEGYEPKTCFER